jgi:hypothetical protein
MVDAVHLGMALAAQVSPSLRCSNGDREKPISAWPQVDLELLARLQLSWSPPTPRSPLAGVVTRVFARIAGAPLDDRSRIEEQKSAAAIASAVRDLELPWQWMDDRQAALSQVREGGRGRSGGLYIILLIGSDGVRVATNVALREILWISRLGCENWGWSATSRRSKKVKLIARF